MIPGTLHYRNPDIQNDYEKVISAVGTILLDYDSNKKIPVWGFGAKYEGIIRHCFQCGEKAAVDGVNEILEAYRQTFQSGLTMSRPTDITEVLKNASILSRNRQEEAENNGKQAFTILLILTDGVVTDIQKTIRTLQSIYDSPMLMVIVGIGNAYFTSIRNLDNMSEECNLNDISHFIEFNAHKNNINSLTETLLEEIPNKMVRYYTRNGISPLPPVSVLDEDIIVETAEEEFDFFFEFKGENN